MNKEQTQNPNSPSHQIVLNDREELRITGATEVLSFDEQSVLLRTVMGTLSIGGEELCVTHLDADSGQICVKGHVTAFFYAEDRDKKSKGFRFFK